MKRLFVILGVVPFLLAAVANGDATAQGDWLQKGKDLLGGYGNAPSGQNGLTTVEIGAGLRDALRVGTETVVGQLGRNDGFNADPSIHIPLPESLGTVQSTLRNFGMSSLLDDLELRLNRAAEVATPKAKKLFWQAISDMTMEDVRAIYEGPDDSATRYFQGRMSRPLAMEMRPIVDQSLAEVGAIQSYENMMGQYRSLPFVPDVKADLTTYVIEKGMEGLFYYIAREEAAIRQNPVKRTTALLQKVFGTN